MAVEKAVPLDMLFLLEDEEEEEYDSKKPLVKKNGSSFLLVSFGLRALTPIAHSVNVCCQTMVSIN